MVFRFSVKEIHCFFPLFIVIAKWQREWMYVWLLRRTTYIYLFYNLIANWALGVFIQREHDVERFNCTTREPDMTAHWLEIPIFRECGVRNDFDDANVKFKF